MVWLHDILYILIWKYILYFNEIYFFDILIAELVRTRNNLYILIWKYILRDNGIYFFRHLNY